MMKFAIGNISNQNDDEITSCLQQAFDEEL